MAVKARMLLVGALPGCRAAETNVGVAHVCRAADSDIEGFANKAVSHQWQLVEMPTAPLIRLELTILDALASQVRRTCTSLKKPADCRRNGGGTLAGRGV